MNPACGAGGQIQLFTQSPSEPINWRLLSGNNRESGRGAAGFADVDQCILAVTALRARLTELHSRVHRVEPNRWLWQLQLAGRPVAVAGHPFDRLIRCEQGLAQFLAGFGAAPIRAGLVVSGARRWGRAS